MRGAGRVHRARSKGQPTDLVTEFDRRSEKLLVARLRRRFPEDHIVAEEGGVRPGTSNRRWLIDPLDGTTNFAHGLPFFSVSLALEVAGVLTAGVVAAPALGWLFAARRGHGARLESSRGRRRLMVSRTLRLSRALLATGFPYDLRSSLQNNFREFEEMQLRSQAVRRVGSAALDLAMVAAGWMDGYWEMKLHPWDLGAGALLVLEAGGRITSWSGGPFDIDSGEAVASNGRIHREMLRGLAAARSSRLRLGSS